MKKILKTVIILLMIVFPNIVSFASTCLKSLIINPVTFENVMYNWILKEILTGVIIAVALIFAFGVLRGLIKESHRCFKLTSICVSGNMIVNILPYIFGDMKIILDLGLMNTPEIWVLDTVLLIISAYTCFSQKNRKY